MAAPILAGLMLGALTILLCFQLGLQRQHFFAPLLIGGIASFYVLFAVIGGNARIAGLETLVALPFFALASATGHKRTMWLVPLGLGLHGCFDIAHMHLPIRANGPAWWPPFCAAFDFAAAAMIPMPWVRILPRTPQP